MIQENKGDLISIWDQHIFFCKGTDSKYFSPLWSVSTVSVTAIQPCVFGAKEYAAYGFVPVKSYIQKQVVGCILPVLFVSL